MPRTPRFWISIATASCLGVAAWSDAHEHDKPEKSEEFTPMVVVATRTENSTEALPASTYVLDAAAVKHAQAMTLDELFKALPGADIQDAGFPGGQPRVSLRGLTPGFGTKRVLVLVDGRRINDAFQGNADFMQVPADAIERIEVLRGPGSALYGSNAMGGVINIVTRRGTDPGSGLIRAAAGSHNTHHTQAAYGFTLGPVDVLAAGSHVQTDGYTRNRDGSRRDWDARHGLINIGLTPSPNSDLQIGVGAYHGKGQDDDAYRDLRNTYQTGLYTLRWSAMLDARLTAHLSRTASRHRYDWSYPGTGRYRQEALAAALQQSFRTGEAHRWTLGGEIRRDDVDIEETTGPINEATDAHSWYIQDEIHAAESLFLTAGLRHDAHADFSDAWSPRLGLLWKASSQADVYASANRAYRAPALSDRFVKTTYWGMTFEGNPNLDPERLTAYELGLRLRFPDQALTSEATVFYNDMKDAFDFIRDPDGVFRNRNATRAVTQGIETMLRYAPAETLTVTLAYTYTDGAYRRFDADPSLKGHQLPYLARHKAGLDVTFSCPLGWAHSVRWQFVDTRQGDARHTPDQEMDAAMTVDWHARAPLTEQLALTASIDNIFDETYQDFPNVERPGRFYMAGIELSL